MSSTSPACLEAGCQCPRFITMAPSPSGPIFQPTGDPESLCVMCNHNFRLHLQGANRPCTSCPSGQCPNFRSLATSTLTQAHTLPQDICLCLHTNAQHSLTFPAPSSLANLLLPNTIPAASTPSIIPAPSPISAFTSAFSGSSSITPASLQAAAALRNRSCLTSLPQNNATVSARNGSIPIENAPVRHPQLSGPPRQHPGPPRHGAFSHPPINFQVLTLTSTSGEQSRFTRLTLERIVHMLDVLKNSSLTFFIPAAPIADPAELLQLLNSKLQLQLANQNFVLPPNPDATDLRFERLPWVIVQKTKTHGHFRLGSHTSASHFCLTETFIKSLKWPEISTLQGTDNRLTLILGDGSVQPLLQTLTPSTSPVIPASESPSNASVSELSSVPSIPASNSFSMLQPLPQPPTLISAPFPLATRSVPVIPCTRASSPSEEPPFTRRCVEESWTLERPDARDVLNWFRQLRQDIRSTRSTSIYFSIKADSMSSLKNGYLDSLSWQIRCSKTSEVVPPPQRSGGVISWRIAGTTPVDLFTLNASHASTSSRHQDTISTGDGVERGMYNLLFTTLAEEASYWQGSLFNGDMVISVQSESDLPSLLLEDCLRFKAYDIPAPYIQAVDPKLYGHLEAMLTTLNIMTTRVPAQRNSETHTEWTKVILERAFFGVPKFLQSDIFKALKSGFTYSFGGSKSFVAMLIAKFGVARIPSIMALSFSASLTSADELLAHINFRHSSLPGCLLDKAIAVFKKRFIRCICGIGHPQAYHLVTDQEKQSRKHDALFRAQQFLLATTDSITVPLNPDWTIDVRS
ncbi:hypothetical protein K435DRAFT_858470 [Dendrothele bispora CBS 962.96]|uniref:Uncharacterized protein n=1 Tax=Dendrothele bispora (strain CBS 962.96) TaxID=1314807 RepID=A0A4S8M473_DENBC|nr:hypothetical protein K435DRAFT_858470 [Dendrothele bispora CBS 962.96]